MPVTLKRDDFIFLQQVHELGLRGLSQEDIASQAGATSVGALKYRLSQLGFRPQPANVLKTTLTDESFSDLVESGQIVVADAAETATPADAADSATPAQAA